MTTISPKLSEKNKETMNKIVDLSKRMEEVLILLLSDNADLRDMLNTEIKERERETAELRDKLDRETGDLRDKLNKEVAERQGDRDRLQAQIDEQAKVGNEAMDDLRKMIEKERSERVKEAGEMDQFFRTENDERKKNLDAVNEWIRAENEKRMAEAEALKARMEREKQELRDFLEADSKAMKDKLNQEEMERQKKEAEMAAKVREAREASENEVIQLHKKLAGENIKRQEEIEELRRLMEKEKEEMREKLEKEKEEMRERLEKENQELRDKLDAEKKGLKVEIEDNHDDSNRKINDLASKLARLNKESNGMISDLMKKMLEENRNLRNLMSQPLSVYFDAFRDEDYLDGGEDYLTFQGTFSNLGGGMDPKSGVFTAPMAGAYLFIVHVCTHDMKKALMTIRVNGNQMASFYDQNHDSNHKNSMAGQSVLLDLELGDKVQVYMFTHTGLQDKKGNHLTQFVGLFLRPKGFLTESDSALENGH